jgi:hypothetical protein
LAMVVSSSEGFWRDGLVGAILLRALMVAAVSTSCGVEVGGRDREAEELDRNFFGRRY